MTARTIIDLQLEAIFGDRLPLKIQRAVDDEMNLGHWVEGYELAAFSDELDEAKSQELLGIVLNQHPALLIDVPVLRKIVEEQLPQSFGAKVLWIVHEDGSFALTDSLRVARFHNGAFTWRTARISFDGIEFDSLVDRKLRGRAWLGSSSYSPDSPFTIDFETGELLEGQIVGF